jgi:O-antigen ligase
VAVVSQLGIAGALLMAVLVGVLLRDLVSPVPQAVDRQALALVSGARAAALASLAAASASGGFADPGLVFFIALAVVGACRKGELAALPRRRPVFAAMHTTIARTNIG